ncbi:Fanconi anemia group D2 protein [Coemansia helicoidea]|uniref:Fanconi anemia group D2 protein n=1 Tax=Coemansia helicoidea TaxID=1286919 RepID=A0ACC1LI66_9FUNG|nr:Fanconi anemia group D2 protein [Coemansia helicoidea]
MAEGGECAEVLRACGVEAAAGSQPVLHTSSALFRHQLNETIRGDAEMAQRIGDYLDELLSDHDGIALYLDPAGVPAADGDGGAAGATGGMHGTLGLAQTESLVRLMLGVDALQPRLVGTLLDKFPEFIGDEGGEGAARVPVKILRQLRWLDYVVDSAGLAEKLLETLGFVPPDMQREIILALPDIVSDADNAGASAVLAGMLSETPELMLPILDTLGSLDCPPSLLQEARSSVIVHLVSAEPADLPVMMRFLLQSAGADAAAPVIQRIRRRLDLDSVVLASRRAPAGADQTPDVLIFDAVATCLRSHKHLRDAWLKIVASSDDEDVGPHTTLDVAVLLIVHPITTHTRRVEAILKAKIDAVSARQVAYTPALIESIIARFPAAFAANFGALLAVAGWLIRTSGLGSQGSRVAAAMVVSAFGAMGMFQRQEIAGELAVHIGSGNANEVDTAARIYLQLARRFPRELRPFAVFIKGLLDYVDNLDIAHVRTIFDALGILSTLAGGGGPDDSMFNDLYIFVRKQLSSVYPKYNRIGIVGTVSLMRQLGSRESPCPGSRDAGGGGSSSSSAAPDAQAANVPALRRAVQLLEMLIDSGRHHSWAFVSMAYDELAHIVETKGLHPQLLTWLHENVSSTFAAQFLADEDALGQRYVLPAGPPAVALSLDDGVATVLDVFNHNDHAAHCGLDAVARRAGAGDMDVDAGGCETPRLRGCVLACLPSLLRLMQVCEKALAGGSLGEIDALLVCGTYLLAPVAVPPPDTAAATAVGQPGRFALATSDDPGTSAAHAVGGDALVGADDEARAELMAAVSAWPPELRRVLCTSVYATVNWLRETINAFADQPAAEIRAKVVQRINQLPRLEGDLEALVGSLAGTADPFLPTAAGLVPEIVDAPAVRTAGGGGGGPVLRAHAAGADEAGPAGPEQGAAYMVDVGGLLLSQDDTRKLVSGDTEALDGDMAGGRGRGRKRKRVSGAAAATAGPSGGDNPAKDLHPFLRELTFSAFGILGVAGGDDERMGGDVESQPRGPLLSAHGLRTLLRELHAVVCAKLVARPERRLPWLRGGSSGGGSVAFGTLATFASNVAGSTAADVFDRLLPILPSLLDYLDSCLETRARFRNDVEVDVGAGARSRCRRRRITAVESPGDVDVVESCIDTLLQTVASVLGWDGLQPGPSRTREAGSSGTALRAVLGALATQGRQTDAAELADLGAHALVRRAFDYLLELCPAVATSGRAIGILRMLAAVRGFSPHHESRADMQAMGAGQRDNTMDGHISALARRVLAAEWQGADDLKPADLELLVTHHILRCPHDRLQLIHNYTTVVFPAFIGHASGGGGEGELPATLRRATFASYYKAVTQALAAVIKEAPLRDMSAQEQLHFAGSVVDSWHALARATQQIDQSQQRAVLLLALRGGYALVDQFAKTILPRLDGVFLVHRDEAIAVLGRMQKCTRILQSICNHSKASKDVRLQSAVPQTKRKLEQLIFQVYIMMDNNDCLGAINMGNLKHRDVRGDVVGSQIAPDRMSSASDSDRIPSDADHSDDDEVGEEDGVEPDDIVVNFAPSDSDEGPLAAAVAAPERLPNMARRGRGGAASGARPAPPRAKRANPAPRRRATKGKGHSDNEGSDE